MTHVTSASIAYIATQVDYFIAHFDVFDVFAYDHLCSMQVRFALSSSPVFSRSDTATDSERFYNSVLDLFEDVDEREEVNDLLTWWNR
jgi:hypothetical protein